MPPITALLHTQNDALRLGRCLETLYPCDDILVVDHGSRDGTAQLAREYGAHVIAAEPEAPPSQYLHSVTSGWIFCLDPRESLTENLAASLYEWKTFLKAPPQPAYSVFLREETAEGWVEVPFARTRLVPATWKRWLETLPVDDDSALTLEGQLLRFVFP